MEIFKSGLKSVLGGPPDARQPTGAETVEKLVDRVVTSTLLEDRRDACRALKALSKKFRLDVGARALDALIQILENDKADNEIIGYALETIFNVVNGCPEEEGEETDGKSSEDLGVEFTEIFIKKTENVSLLLSLMEEYDFKVRWPVVKLLTALLMHKPKELQECILTSPMGVSKLMDLLGDTREIIRNDTLLLLAHLTRGNANIQKIVVFESAFDRLLDIMKVEGYSDGGVIVEDCLLVLLTLLKNNNSNQSFFKEGNYVQYLAPFFDFQDTQEHNWSSQKTLNIHRMLQVIRVLVSPNNPQQITLAAQKAMHQYGLLKQLCNILMASGVPADILSETINTVAEIIRGNHNNQEYFSSLTAPTTPPRPSIVVLLMSMVNEKQAFNLRCSVLYCFQCFLYRNELGQAQIIQTLLPQSTCDVLTITVGQLLCGGLFSPDSLSNWFAAVALSHCLVDNSTQKEQLLRVQLATGVGNPAVSLINQCCIMLQQGAKLQTKLGLLILMCTWLAHCPNAVAQFLSIATNIPFLTSQVSLTEHDENEDLVQGMCAFLLGICIEFNANVQEESNEPNSSKEDLCQLISKRIGLETFLAKLGAISKNEQYSRAAQNPSLKFAEPKDVLFDYEFCRLFKSLEDTIIRAAQPTMLNGIDSEIVTVQLELQQYKGMIREQDMQLHDLRVRFSELTVEHEKTKVQNEEMCTALQQLKDQNALLKAQKAVGTPSQESLRDHHLNFEKLTADYNKLKEGYDKMKDLKAANSLDISEEGHEKESQTQELLDTIATQSKEIESLKAKVAELEAKKSESSENRERIAKKLEKDMEKLERDMKKAIEEKVKIEEQFSELQKEQEELLVLLTEQEDKVVKYKARLKELGEQVEDEDEEDFLGDEFDEMDNQLNDAKDVYEIETGS